MTKARDLANSAAAFASVSATELGYVDGVTSAIQTQMDAKAPSSTAVTLTGTQTLTNKTLTSPVIASVINNTLTSTTGDIIYASAANTPARLGIGTTGQVLNVASGIPAWATPAVASSGMTLITRQTFSNVASTTTLFDGVFTATYEQYLVTLTRYFAGTAADDAHFNFRSGAPATLITQYYGAIPFINTSTSTWTVGVFRNDTKAQLSTNSGDTGQKSSGTINISNVTSSTTYPTFAGQFNNLNNESATFFSGGMASSTAVTGFILSSSSSNISGTVAVYGLAIA